MPANTSLTHWIVSSLYRPWHLYAIAVASVAAAVPIRLLLDAQLGVRAPGLPFTLAIIASAWIGGFGPGVLATLLSVVCVQLFVDSPLWARADPNVALLVLSMFIAGGGLLSLICEFNFRNRALSRRQQMYLDEALDPVIAWRMDGRIEFWSGGAQRVYGFTSADAIGRHLDELLSVEYPGGFATVLSALTRDGQWSGELTHRTRDGRTLIVESRMICQRERDNITIVESTRDITERRQAETRLDVVFSAIGDHLVTYDREWRYTYVNDAAAKTLGKPKEELLGRSIWDLFPAAVGNQYYRELHEALQTQRPIRSEHYYAPSDIWYENYIYPAADGVTVFSSDITRRKKAEVEQRESERRKDEFIAVLAHELRGPLAPLRNGIHLIERFAADNPRLRQTATMMERQMRQLVRLIDDLLDLSRITRGKLALQRGPVAIESIVQTVVEDVRSTIEQRGLSLQLNLSATANIVNGDAARLEQIVGNLLANALKYTDHGRIVVTTRTEQADVVIEVSDTGIGIPEGALTDVFQMFVQVPEHRQRAGGGLGIGLALVKNLVELHGGSVRVQSAGANRGSTFIVRLPLTSGAIEQPVQPTTPLRPATPLRVLVVDDNQDSAQSLAMLLSTAGHSPRIAHDGLEALEVGQSFEPHVVLMDLGMPTMDGYTAARQMREQAWGRRVTLVAVTGWGQADDRRRSQEAGFDQHLTKPVDAATLFATLELSTHRSNVA